MASRLVWLLVLQVCISWSACVQPHRSLACQEGPAAGPHGSCLPCKLGTEYSEGVERLSLPGPRTWGLGQAEAPKPLQRWYRPHSISAPSSNAAHVGQLPARGCGVRSRQRWAGRHAVWLGTSFCCPSRQFCSRFSLSLLLSQSLECDRVQASPALVCAHTASHLHSDHSMGPCKPLPPPLLPCAVHGVSLPIALLPPRHLLHQLPVLRG